MNKLWCPDTKSRLTPRQLAQHMLDSALDKIRTESKLDCHVIKRLRFRQTETLSQAVIYLDGLLACRAHAAAPFAAECRIVWEDVSIRPAALSISLDQCGFLSRHRYNFVWQRGRSGIGPVADNQVSDSRRALA